MTRWGLYYGAGAAMGFTPRQVRDMTPWEFAHVRAGWIGANNPEALESGVAEPPDDVAARALELMATAADTVT
jgi:broad specificity phosphatase PhoE